MLDSEDKEFKSTVSKTIVYDYLFNYFGGEKFKGKVICGACVQIAIRAYKNGEEVKFAEEPCANNRFFNEIYNVSFDRNNLFIIQKNLQIDNLYRLIYGWDKIEAEIVGYTLEFLCGVAEDEFKKILMEKEFKELPEEFKSLPCTESMEVTAEEFNGFLIKHIEDFDISDNINAQVPSVSYI